MSSAFEILPRRCCVCLECRTALFPGHACDCSPEAQVACFEEHGEREKIVSAAWGTEDQRVANRQFLERVRHRVAGASLGGFSVGTLLAQSMWGFGPGTAVLAVAGSFVGGSVMSYYSRTEDLEPRGGGLLGESQCLGLRAQIVGEHALVSPATGHECLAYCLELRVLQGRQESVMYRDAVTSGFTAKLGTGERVKVPAGRLRFAGPAPEILDVDNLELEAYLESVDPKQSSGGMFRPLHVNLVREQVLFAGDKVDLNGDFSPVAMRGDALYRDSLRTYLQPEGIAEVRLHR